MTQPQYPILRPALLVCALGFSASSLAEAPAAPPAAPPVENLATMTGVPMAPAPSAVAAPAAPTPPAVAEPAPPAAPAEKPDMTQQMTQGVQDLWRDASAKAAEWGGAVKTSVDKAWTDAQAEAQARSAAAQSATPAAPGAPTAAAPATPEAATPAAPAQEPGWFDSMVIYSQKVWKDWTGEKKKDECAPAATAAPVAEPAPAPA